MQVDNSLLNKFAKLVDNSEQNKQSVPTEIFGIVTTVPSDEVDYYVVEPETATQGEDGFNGNVTGNDNTVPSAECQCYSDITDEIQQGDRVRIRIDSGKSAIIENMVKREVLPKMVICHVESQGGKYTPQDPEKEDPPSQGYYTGTINSQSSGWNTYAQYIQNGFKPTGLASVTLLVSKNNSEYKDITQDSGMLPTTAFAKYSISDEAISVTYALGVAAGTDNRKFKVALNVVMMRADFFNNQGE